MPTTNSETPKDQLISKCLFAVLNFFQKTNENELNWGIIVLKLDWFVRFLGESSAWINHYDFVWPLKKNQILKSQQKQKGPVQGHNKGHQWFERDNDKWLLENHLHFFSSNYSKQF